MTTADIDRIRNKTNATAILSLQDEICRDALGIDYESHRKHALNNHLTLVNSPMRDFDPSEQRHSLPKAVKILCHLLIAEHKVYVHCTAGINRSPLTVLAYLAFVERMPVMDALALIRNNRPEAQPYLQAFHGCYRDLIKSNRYAIEVRTSELSRRNPGRSLDLLRLQAEKETIRQLFLNASVVFDQYDAGSGRSLD